VNSPGRHEPQKRARRRALQALYQWHLTGHEAGEIVAQFKNEQDFTSVDVALFEALVFGIAERQAELEAELQPYCDRPWALLDVIEKVVLSIGAFELRGFAETPAPVIIDEAVDLARRFGAEQGHAFVNGVLDRAARAWRNGPTAQAGGRDRDG
jgi:transcription antitermination protein NusB